MDDKTLYSLVNDYIVLSSELSATYHLQYYHGYESKHDIIKIEKKLKLLIEDISYKINNGEDLSEVLFLMGYIDEYWFIEITSRLYEIVQQ